MKIIIETSEALSFNLNGSDLTVLGTIRELLKENQGYTEQSGKLKFKWLSAKLIFQHLQTAAFKTARQLNNIINKLIRAGLLLKRMFFGKPYFCDIKEQAKTAAPKTAQNITPQPSHASAVAVRTVKNSANPAPTANEIKDYTTRQGYKGFTVAEFMEYNARRNWAGDWKEHAQRWYEKQIKFKQKPLTYKELFELVAAHKINQTDYQLNKADGLWYKIPKSAPAPKSASVSGMAAAASVSGTAAAAASVSGMAAAAAPVPGMAAAIEELTPQEIETAIKEFHNIMNEYEKKKVAPNTPINENGSDQNMINK